ncbi:MAG TPA: SurA N-terminal domain-containing protein, partial [Kiloniellales bacterium]|nr:SurA N-terminal domain-containing protein [Kiloniellales bacterium]
MAVRTQNIFIKAGVYILFGLLIIAFGIWGIGDIFRGGGRAQAVAEVGDSRILQQEFQRALAREMNRLSNRLGTRLDLEQARSFGLVDQVLSNLITQTLLETEARRLGLVVTESQLIDAIQSEPAFRNEQGQFDRSRLSQALLTSGLSEAEFLTSLRQDTMTSQMVGAVSAAATAPRELAEALYRYREERRVARYLLVPNESITDLPEP